MRYCKNCKQNVQEKSYGVGWAVLTVLGFLFFLIPGLIILVWRLSGSGKCPICGAKNFR